MTPREIWGVLRVAWPGIERARPNDKKLALSGGRPMTPERRREILGAIASSEPLFFEIIDHSKQAVLRVLAGDNTPKSQGLGSAGVERINSIFRGQAQVLGLLRGKRVLVSPSIDVRVCAIEAIFQLQAAFGAVDDLEPRS